MNVVNFLYIFFTNYSLNCIYIIVSINRQPIKNKFFP